MSFVFISHASEDKPRIRPIVDAVRSAGLRVFLDNPVKAGYSAEEAETILCIREGERWEEEIDKAKRAAGCILVCWSERATAAGVMDGTARLIWMGEADYARTEKKLVACTIDGVNPASLPGTHSGQQMPLLDRSVLSEEAWSATIAGLVRNIQRVINQSSFRYAKEAEARRGDLALPIYANRYAQENAFNAALRAVEDKGGAHPIILHGPENELPEDLVKRMSELSGEQAALGARWREVRAPYWPQEAGTPKAFQDAYRLELISRLKCRGGDHDMRIAEKLAGEEVTAIIHRLKAKDWRRDEGVRVKAWIDYWNDLARAHGKVRVLPILVAPLRKARPGWHKEDGKRCYPPGNSGGPIDNARLSRTLGETAKRAGETGTPLSDLPILGPIRRRDADEWLEDWKDRFAEGSLAGARQAVDAMFGKRRFLGPNPDKQGVTHGDFLDQLKDICVGAAQTPT